MGTRVTGYPDIRFRTINRIVKLRTGARGNKEEHEKLTEEEQEDHARDEGLPNLVFGVDCVRHFLVFIVYSSSLQAVSPLTSYNWMHTSGIVTPSSRWRFGV